MTGALERPNLRHTVKFHQDRSIRCRNMTIFRFFKMVAARHLGFLKFAILNVLWRKECQCAAPCQTSSKSVKRLRRYRDFTVFQVCGRRHLGFSKIQFLTADT